MAGDIRLPGTRATDIAPLGLNTRPQALSFSHGSEAVAVGYRMAPAKAGSARRAKMVGWPHSPVHRLAEAGAYRVTCGTYMKQHQFQSSERLRLLCENPPAPGHQVWLEPAGLGGFLQPLPLGGPFTAGPCDAANLGERVAHGNANRVEPGRPHAGKAGMVPVLGDTSHLSTLVPCAAELRPPQRGASPAGSRTIALPLVLGGLVGAEGKGVLLPDGDEIRDRAAEGTGRV